MPARRRTIKRRVRSLGGKVIRRFNLLPNGTPDRLGDDDALLDRTLRGDVVVFFPDTGDSLYQLRGWLGPLAELHRTRGVTIVCMDSRVAHAVAAETTVPVVTIGRDDTLDRLVAAGGVKLMLYVNYNPLNFIALRLRSVVHVSLLHGDSDKTVSVSNQIKAYDYSFVAGQAAIDRLTRFTAFFDAAERCIPVGRPALDTDRAAVAERRAESGAEGEPGPTDAAAHPGPGIRPSAGTRAGTGARPRTVLYAPTWEGAHAAVSYSSLISHGDGLVRALIAAGHRVIYRPHPLTGVRLGAYGEADAEIRRRVEAAGQRVSVGTALAADFAAADLVICDVSAVAIDWLATGKPFIVTEPAGGTARDAPTRLLSVVPRLPVAAVAEAARLVARELDDDPGRADRLALREYYLGDTRPGASLERFLSACERLCELRDREWRRISRNETSPSVDHGGPAAASASPPGAATGATTRATAASGPAAASDEPAPVSARRENKNV